MIHFPRCAHARALLSRPPFASFLRIVPIIAAALILCALPAASRPAHAAGPQPTQPPPLPAPTLAPTPTPNTPPAPPQAAAPAAPVARTPNALLLAAPGVELDGLLALVEQSGGAPLHILPPGAAVLALPPAADAALSAAGARIERIPVDAAQVAATYGQEAAAAALYWNQRFPALAPPAPGRLAPTQGRALTNDALIAPTPAPDSEAATEPSGAPGRYQTSVFLARTVIVSLIFPESDGGSEYWRYTDPAYPSSDRIDLAIAEIMAGLDWWIAADARAGVSFSYLIYRDIPVPVEPITFSSADEDLWIGPALAALGFSNSDGYFAQVRDLNDAQRSWYGSDWAYTIFVVDSLNDADGMMSNGRFGYAYLGGPFSVMTYDNDGWGIDQMDRVTAHEMVHIFQGADEYVEGNSCYATFGYLDVPNLNQLNPSEGSCGVDEPCQMKSGSFDQGACPWTRGQIGWRDSDGDNIFDPLDTHPTLGLNPWPPEAGNDSTPTYVGSVLDVPYPSPTQSDVTINRIADLYYRLDGGPWTFFSPDDGWLDGEYESFTLTLPPLADGAHVLDIGATNSVGNVPPEGPWGPQYIYDTFTVDTVPPESTTSISSYYYMQPSARFSVDYQGSDSLSGVQSWDLQVSTDGGPWQDWLTGVLLSDANSILYDGENGHTYYFQARGQDFAGNVGAWSPYASTTIDICQSGADFYEQLGDNDFSAAVTTHVDGSLGNHTVHLPGDIDWVRFPAVAGVQYDISTVDIGGMADTYIALYDQGGAPIAENDDYGGRTSFLSYIPPQDGDLFLSVRSYYPYTFGCANDYGLIVQAIDSTPPSIDLVANNGAAWSRVTDIPLALAAWDGESGLDLMRVLVDGEPWDAPWLPFAADATATLAAGTAPQTVEVQLRDRAGNINAAQAVVSLDQIPPAGSISAPSPLSTGDATLSLSFSDGESGVQAMQIGLDAGAWSGWETPAAARAVTWSGADGWHSARVRLRDRVGNLSPVYESTVLIDRTAPQGSLAVVSIDGWVNQRAVVLQIGWVDEGTGVVDLRLRANGGGWSAWSAPVAEMAWTLPAGDGAKVIEVELRDGVGHTAIAEATVHLDTAAPRSTLAPLPATTVGPIRLAWSASDALAANADAGSASGSDMAAGSDVVAYDVQMRVGGGDWQALLSHTARTQTTVTGVIGQSYSFRVRAYDRAGNAEAWGSGGAQVGSTIVGVADDGDDAIYLPFVQNLAKY